MNLRLSRWTMGGFAAVLLTAGYCWATYFPLGPSHDDWGMKYDVELKPAAGDKLDVHFTLADEGRLKPIASATVVAFSKPDYDGGRSYLVNAPIVFKPTKDGKLAGQAQMSKEFIDIAQIRILTFFVDGQRQTAGAASYYIPLKKALNKASAASLPAASDSSASPPAANRQGRKPGPVHR